MSERRDPFSPVAARADEVTHPRRSPTRPAQRNDAVTRCHDVRPATGRTDR
ncbi:hypothetical protein [Polymorphospora lycopeni]|uniref:Uncharacterized protein n=1 Tax=Polymorphospora lycopeni TaxID=3140240 RepID=A0ABV5D214_9ACTN